MYTALGGGGAETSGRRLTRGSRPIISARRAESGYTPFFFCASIFVFSHKRGAGGLSFVCQPLTTHHKVLRWHTLSTSDINIHPRASLLTLYSSATLSNPPSPQGAFFSTHAFPNWRIARAFWQIRKLGVFPANRDDDVGVYKVSSDGERISWHSRKRCGLEIFRW